MNKYKSGNLFLVYFDKYGSSKGKVLVADYMDGMREIKEYLKENPDESCILERVIYNSKDVSETDGVE